VPRAAGRPGSVGAAIRNSRSLSSGSTLQRRASSQAALVERFRQAKRDGDLPDHVDPEALTSYLYAILQGMAVQAGSGASRAELERVVETSLMMWPTA
jgi:hypothetical protein